MEYKTLPLYQRITSINEGIKNSLKKSLDFKGHEIVENQKLLIGKSSYDNRNISSEFDFVVFNKSNFDWTKQNKKDDVLLACKVLFKTSVESLKKDIEAELFKFHSIQAVRKMIILLNTKDVITDEYVPVFFMNNYDLFLNFPVSLHEKTSLDKCSACGTVPSKIEPWFYHENSLELLPLDEYIDDFSYFGM
ncbi:MAG: hypothetical protein U0457_20835 [Candidatus Sericytochromatia bacterium]